MQEPTPQRRSIGPLKLWRVSKGLSQKEAAERLGFAYPQGYGESELGRRLLSERKLRELDKRADLPGLKVAYVLWYFNFTDEEIRTVLMSQATAGVVLR